MSATVPSKTITVIGSLNTDLRTLTTRIPDRGETLTSLSFSTGPGGKGANQAVACARLSRRSKKNTSSSSLSSSSSPVRVDVEMVGAVGDDAFGHELLSDLERDGVDVRGVRVDGDMPTGTAVVIVEEESGENRIMVHGGANAGVGIKVDIARVMAQLFDREDGGTPDLIVMQCEIPLNTIMTVMRETRRQDVEVLWNPAPAPTREAVGNDDGRIADALEGLEHLIFNHDEAVALAAITTTDTTPGFFYGNGTEDRELRPDLERLNIAQHFHSLGVRNVIITLGADGVFWSCTSDWSDEWKGEVHSLPAAKVGRVVDTTAAGDTFVGAYAVEVIRGTPVVDAIRWANRAAAKTVERDGAMRSIPSREEVDG